MSDKTEQPTSKKLRDARQKGQVASSKDIPATATLLVLFAVIAASWPSAYQRLQRLIVLPAEFYDVPFAEAYPAVTMAVLTEIALLSLPALGAVVVAGVLANYFQVGVLFVFEPVTPDLKKINPFEKAKQIFSIKNLIEFAKSCVKVGFLGFLMYTVVRDAIGPLIQVPYSGVNGVTTLVGELCYVIAKYTMFVYVVIGAFDFWFQRRQHTKGLMMTKDEVKREYKEMEGDPHIKGKRKQLHQELVMSDNTERARKATVLVTNPTHRAVALYYKEGETKLPLITAMGEGYNAEQMIKAAREAGVPIMQNIPLAHDLFNNGRADQYIPAELIGPIAEVLRWVQQLQSEGRLS